MDGDLPIVLPIKEDLDEEETFLTQRCIEEN